MKSASIYSFAHGQEHATEMAAALGLTPVLIDCHTFPDGESLIRVPSSANTAILYCPLDRPDDKLTKLMLAADALRRSGSRRIVLVAPYLCYMRQDKAFHEGEPISQKAIARFLSSLFDRVVTVDAHLHRVSSIAEVFPEIEAENLFAEDSIVRFAADSGFGADTIIAGPDEESAQWVDRVAAALGAGSVVARKTRRGDRDVEVIFPDNLTLTGKRVLIADDIVSSGGTMLAAIAALKARGASSVHVAVTHALFDDKVYRAMLSVGAATVWSTTSVPHRTNTISLAGLLAGALTHELKE